MKKLCQWPDLSSPRKNPHEAKLYKGSENPFRLSNIVSNQFDCSFAMYLFPFDNQTCFVMVSLIHTWNEIVQALVICLFLDMLKHCYKHWSILADHTTTTERQNQACPGWKGQLLWGYWAAAVHINSNRSNFAPGRFTKLEYFCSIFIRFSIHVVQVVPLCAAALLPSCMRVWKFPPRMPLLCSSSAGAKQLIVVVFLSSSFPLLRKSRAGEFLAGTFKRAGMAVIKRQDIKGPPGSSW